MILCIYYIVFVVLQSKSTQRMLCWNGFLPRTLQHVHFLGHCCPAVRVKGEQLGTTSVLSHLTSFFSACCCTSQSVRFTFSASSSEEEMTGDVH